MKERLEAAGFTVPTAVIHGHPALVDRRSRFRWLVTRLHVFGVAFEASELTEGRGQELTAAARRHAVENKRGLPRGLQTGTATIPVFITTGAEPCARSWFAKEPEHLFGALRLPVLVEDEQLSYFRGRMTPG